MTRRASIHSLEESGIRDRWSALENVSVLQTPFASLAYVEDLAAVLERSVKAVFVANAEAENEDVAGALVLERRKSGVAYIGLTGFTPFSAIAARRLPLEAAIHARTSWLDVLTRTLGSSVSKVDLILPPPITDVRPFQWARWDVSPLYTFQLTIDDPERCLSGWSEGARRVFSRTKDRFHLESSQASEHDIVRMCLAAYDRHNKRAPLSSDKLEGLVLRQVRRRQAICYTVHEHEKKEPDAGVAVLGSPPDAYYWVAGSIPGPAMTVLVGKLMFALSEKGFQRFDLVGANTPSIAEFKRRLNPTLVSYFRVRHVRNRMLRIFLELKEAIRR